MGTREYVVKPHVPTPMPTYEGTENGQRVGDWEWTTVGWTESQWSPGQYWFYYGPFGDITADFKM